MGAKTLYVFRRILLPLVLPAAATSRRRTIQKRPRGIPAAPFPGSSLVDVSGDKEPAAPVR